MRSSYPCAFELCMISMPYQGAFAVCTIFMHFLLNRIMQSTCRCAFTLCTICMRTFVSERGHCTYRCAFALCMMYMHMLGYCDMLSMHILVNWQSVSDLSGCICIPYRMLADASGTGTSLCGMTTGSWAALEFISLLLQIIFGMCRHGLSVTVVKQQFTCCSRLPMTLCRF